MLRVARELGRVQEGGLPGAHRHHPARRARAAARVRRRRRRLYRRGLRAHDPRGRGRGPGRCGQCVLRGHRLQPGAVRARARGRSASGLAIEAHAEQLSNLGGAALAARHGALSADHIEELPRRGRRAGDGRGRHGGRAAARRLPDPARRSCRRSSCSRRHGVPIALATDANPGSSPMFMPTLMLNLGCTLFRLTPREALAGMTAHGARALGLADTGRVAAGQRADLPCGRPATAPSWLTPCSPVASPAASMPASPTTVSRRRR